MKKFLAFSLKLLLSLFLTLGLIELGLRSFPALIPLPLLIYFNEAVRAGVASSQNLSNQEDVIFIERDDGGPPLWVYRPLAVVRWPVHEHEGAVSTRVMDDQGFCNPPENSYHLPAIDVIALGDSFTTCYAVNPQDTWSSQLAALTHLSVYNLGKIGIGLHSEIQILKKFGLAKSPHIVILNVYEGNDLRDALNYYSYRQKHQAGGTTPAPATAEQSLSPLGLLERYSYAFNLFVAFKQYYQNIPAAVLPDDSAPLEPTPPGAPDIDFRYDLIFGQTDILFNPKNEDKDEVRHARMVRDRTDQGELLISGVIGEALTNFVALSRQQGFIPVVMYTPAAYTAYEANVVFEDPSLKGLMADFSHYQRAFLEKAGQKLGYTFIDLTPALQDAARTGGPAHLLYFASNRHLTPAGHSVIAKKLSQSLQTLTTLPE